MPNSNDRVTKICFHIGCWRYFKARYADKPPQTINSLCAEVSPTYCQHRTGQHPVGKIPFLLTLSLLVLVIVYARHTLFPLPLRQRSGPKRCRHLRQQPFKGSPPQDSHFFLCRRAAGERQPKRSLFLSVDFIFKYNCSMRCTIVYSTDFISCTIERDCEPLISGYWQRPLHVSRKKLPHNLYGCLEWFGAGDGVVFDIQLYDTSEMTACIVVLIQEHRRG